VEELDVAVAYVPDFRSPSHELELALHRAKFAIPPAPRRYLARPRLTSRVAALLEPSGARAPIVIVSAPLGGGKSTLVSAVARERRRGPVAWCNVDESDNAPERVAHSILEAVLAASQPEVISDAARRGRSASDALEEALLVAGSASEFLLVLDDCERLRPDVLQSTVRRLVTHAPSNLAIVVISSRDLPLLDRKAAPAPVLREADLLFTPEEMCELFRHERLPAPDDALVRWTNGIPGCVPLAVIASADPAIRDRAVAAALRGDATAHAALHDIITEHLDADRQDALLASAIVDPVCGELVSELIGRPVGNEALRSIAAMGFALEPLPGCPDWYRHRYPSRNLLLANLQHERRDQVPGIFTAAARWFLAHGHRDRAMRCAIHGGDTELRTELVRDRWVEAALDDADSGLEVLAPIRDEATTADAALALAAVELDSGDVTRAEARLEAMSGSRPRDQLLDMLVRLRLARATSNSSAIDAQCARLRKWSRSDACTPALRRRVERLVGRSEAEAALIAGRLEDAAEMLDALYRRTAMAHPDRLLDEVTASRAVVTALAGRVRQAAALVQELGDPWCEPSRFTTGLRALARAVCDYHADELLAGHASAAQARSILPAGVYRDGILPVVRARFKASIGDHAGATRLRTRAAAAVDTRLVDVVSASLGLTAIEAGDADDDELDLTDAPSPYAVARESLLAATRSYTSGRPDDAWPALEVALALVERHGYFRLVLDSGLAVDSLLRDYIARAEPYSQTAWHLLQRLPSTRATDGTLAVETLTERELAVLRHLPSMKSNEEIAAEMFFSVNTIKTHLKSIYRKLGVNRRRAAVEEARARSLL
jgi:LuxR family maltose regulon positive regulatory protein